MAENLKVTKYKDGTTIPTGHSDSEWESLSIGSYAVYDNDPVNADLYGNLYNWYAVGDSRGLCMEGFHVPTDDEFKELEMFLGMCEGSVGAPDTGSWDGCVDNKGTRGTNEGSKLAGNDLWWSSGDLENNSEFGTSGFYALPAGERSAGSGQCGLMGGYAYFWSSSECDLSGEDCHSSDYHWYRNLHFNHSGVNRAVGRQNEGISIRCLFDELIEGVWGCTDPEACNYDETATDDDGSCEFYTDLCGEDCGDNSTCPTITDIDGNVYTTIQIGDQLWMAENLKVTHYNNGDEIPYPSNEDWGSYDEGQYGVFDNDSTNADIYGNLYNWAVVDDDRGVCPEGFHIPSDVEIMELEMYLGMSEEDVYTLGYRGTDEGSKLAGNSDLWWDGFLDNNSEFGTSGFNALPAGYRVEANGYYGSVGSKGYFWSSSELNSGTAWYRLIEYFNPRVSRYSVGKQKGCSVRCLSDETLNTTILVPSEYSTIQSAIDVAVEGDSVLVSAGTYYENINFNGKNIALIGEDRETTIIDGNQSGSVVTFNGGENENALLSGFTINNGNGYMGGGVSIGANVSSSPSIINNIIINNTAQYGGGIYAEYSFSKFHHNVIAFNYGDNFGGGIYRDDDGGVEIFNCTIYGNESSRGGGINSSSSDIVKNSIIYNNTASQDGNNIEGSNLIISYSDIQNGYDGEGNIDSDPLFTDPDNGDYTLQPSSPCIDAGDPESELDPDGTRADMGAYYFHQELGCTNPEATNYLPNAEVDDGSCCIELWGECYNIEETTSIDLIDSGLTGEIPSEIGNLTNLTGLSLINNQLSGEIPSEIGSLTNLWWLDLQSNQLAGEIPSEIGNLTSLTSLSLSSNELTGEIPSEIGNLTNLTGLTLSNNELTGEIPSEIWTMTNLSYLNLSSNQLTGEIPVEIGNMTLGYLYLSNNQLTGVIPLSICNLPVMNIPPDIFFTIYSNQLCPPYPDCGLGPITSENSQDISECYGCTNPEAINFDSEIINDDGSCEYNYSIGLHAVANLVSFWALPDDNSLDNMFIDLDGIITGVIGEGTAAVPNDLLGWIGSLSEISCTSGYWVTVSEDVIWDVVGTELCPCDTVYQIHEGNNLVSWPSSSSCSVGDAIPDEFEPYITGIIGEGVAAYPNEVLGWIGSLSELQPTKGYWLGSSVNMVYNWDACSCSSSLSRTAFTKINNEYFNQSTKQAFYFIEDIENIEMGDWILAYNGDEVIGARAWTGNIIDVPAMGDDGSDYTKGYIETGVVPSFKILRDGELIDLEGDIPSWENNQLYMVSSLTEAVALPESFSLDRAYPNPFNPTTTLSFALPVDAAVSLSIYNMQGREVTTLINANMDAGYHSITWNADGYSSGVYFVKMVAGEFVNTQKLMLIK